MFDYMMNDTMNDMFDYDTLIDTMEEAKETQLLGPTKEIIKEDDIRLDPDKASPDGDCVPEEHNRVLPVLDNGDQMTTNQIAEYLNITNKQVLTAERRAMKKLKNNKLMYKLYLENIVYP